MKKSKTATTFTVFYPRNPMFPSKPNFVTLKKVTRFIYRKFKELRIESATIDLWGQINKHYYCHNFGEAFTHHHYH